MKVLGSVAAALAAIVTYGVVAEPAGAVEPGYTASGSTQCGDGRGVVTLRQEQVTADAIHVVITGSGLRNGRWQGGYNLGEQEHPIDTQVVDHELRVELDLEGDAAQDAMVALVKRRAWCSVGLFGVPHGYGVSGLGGFLIARFPEPGSVATRAIVSGCENGTRWRYTVTASFGDGVMGEAGSGLVCRNELVRIPRSVMSGHGFEQVRPDGVRLVARSSDGDVRRIGYRISTPAAG